MFIVHSRGRAADALSGNAGRVLLVDDLGADALIVEFARALHQVWPFSSCLSQTALGLLPAARINQALGLPGVSVHAVERTRDKCLMRRWLHEAGLCTLPFAAVETAEDLTKFVDQHGLPVILKPRCGIGSRGVTFIDDWPALGGLCWPSAESMMAEAYIGGTEFSVDTFSCGGRHQIVAVTAKRIARDIGYASFVEIGHSLPAPLTDEEEIAIGDRVRSWLDALEIRDWPVPHRGQSRRPRCLAHRDSYARRRRQYSRPTRHRV